jgi:hypothetical protein
MVRAQHGIKEIFSTNNIARKHFSPNQNARTRHHHGHGTARHTKSALYGVEYGVEYDL